MATAGTLYYSYSRTSSPLERPDPDLRAAARIVEHVRLGRVMFPPARKGSMRAQDAQTLVAVYALGSPTLGALAKALGLNPSSIDGALGRLEAEGFVQRVPDPEDWRRRVARITDSGIERALEVVSGVRLRVEGEGLRVDDFPSPRNMPTPGPEEDKPARPA